MCPPATSNCPSERNVCPLQNMLKPAWATAVMLVVAGSQICGLSPSPYVGQNNTLPLGSKLVWVASQGNGWTADHCPTSDGSACARAVGVTMTSAAKSVAVITSTDARTPRLSLRRILCAGSLET